MKNKTGLNVRFCNWIDLVGLDITILGSNDFYSYRNEVIYPLLS